MILTTSLAAPRTYVRGLEMPWNRVLEPHTSTGDLAARALNPWHPQEFTMECVGTVEETPEMTTFLFRRLDGAPLAFRAGQYLNIAFPVHGADAEPVDRSYSLSTAPTAPWTFGITVKRDKAGLVSPWIHENIQVGTTLEALGPVGAFHLPDVDRRARFLFLAAGSGITPLMSMIRTICSLPGKADVILLYHDAVASHFAFSRELEHLAAVDPRLRVHYSLGDRGAPDDWQWLSGRLNAQMIEQVAPDTNGRQVYACGPSGYLDAVLELMPLLHVDDSSVHLEWFTADTEVRAEYEQEIDYAAALAEEEPAEPASVEPQLPAEPPSGSTKDGTCEVRFVRSGLTVRLGAHETVLQGARREGVRIPVNCQEGMCGSCKSVLISGEVRMNHQGGIRQREVDAGKFLPCCSTAVTDLVVDL